MSVWWLVRYAAAIRSKGYIVPGVPYWAHTVQGNKYTVPAPGSQLHRPMTIVTGCGAITSNTIDSSRLYTPCTAYASTSTTEVRTHTSLSAGSYLTEIMSVHIIFQYTYQPGVIFRRVHGPGVIFGYRPTPGVIFGRKGTLCDNF